MFGLSNNPTGGLRSEGLPSRRAFLRNATLAAAGLSLSLKFNHENSATSTAVNPDRFLKNFQRKAVDFLNVARHPSGLYYDIVCTDPKVLNTNRSVSMAGTGFALASTVAACASGSLNKERAAEDVLQTLMSTKAILRPEYRGWLPHFVDPSSGEAILRDKFTGERVADSEISSIDTALFMLGALSAGEFFKGRIGEIARELFDQIDFRFLLGDQLQFGHGFYVKAGKAEKIDWRWDTDSEGPLVSLLALGSRQEIPTEVWSKAWERTGKSDFPLFVYYYPMCFLDLKDKQDPAGFNFWQRAKDAIHYQAGLAKYWGFSACMFPEGGYCDNQPAKREGKAVVAPTATLACWPIEPKLVEDQIQSWQFDDCRFGLPGSAIIGSNGRPDWKSEYYLTIDHLSTFCMLDGAENGQIHSCTNNCEVVKKAMERAMLVSDGGYQNTLTYSNQVPEKH